MALFSATMPEAILQITHEYQSEDAEYIRVTPKEITVSAIKQAYYKIARQDKKEAICRLLDYYQPVRGLIFCNTKKMVDEMAEFLKERGYQAEGLHGDLSQYQRDTVMNSFRNGRCNFLIATDVVVWTPYLTMTYRKILNIMYTVLAEPDVPAGQAVPLHWSVAEKSIRSETLKGSATQRYRKEGCLHRRIFYLPKRKKYLLQPRRFIQKRIWSVCGV